jgi:hypothetical protein
MKKANNQKIIKVVQLKISGDVNFTEVLSGLFSLSRKNLQSLAAFEACAILGPFWSEQTSP